MRPSEFLAFAIECQAGMPSEAAARSAVSRAYYVAWPSARAYLRENDVGLTVLSPGGNRLGSHAQVIESIAFIGNPGAQQMRARLNNLRRLRSRADYDLDDSQVLSRADNAIELAGSIIAWLDSLPE